MWFVTIGWHDSGPLWCSGPLLVSGAETRGRSHTVMLHQWSLKLEAEHDVARRRAVMLHSLKEVVDSSSGDAVAVAAIQNVVARQVTLEFDHSARTVHRLWSSNNLICAIKRAC